MTTIYKFTASLFAVFILSIVILVITDLAAVGESDSKGESNTKRHKIEKLDISGDFYYAQEGRTSWYGKRFHNRKTASGEKYNMYALSAAHRNLPFGTIIRVTNQENHKSVLVRVNDRGPFIHSKILDLSMNSYEEIDGFDNPEVRIEALVPNNYSFLNKKDEEYYFGYSFEYPLVCLPSSSIKFLDSSPDFEEAVQIYKEYLDKLPGRFLYLMTVSNSSKYIYESENENIYYIGLFDGNSLQFAEESN